MTAPDTKEIRAQMEALDGHTPGPWHDDLGETYRAKSADGMNIATANWVTLLGRLPSAEVKKNIGLIAAAPDLHATIPTLCDALDAERAEVERLRAALAWYGEQSRLARIIHSEGDAGRHALQTDGGNRARAALAQKEE